MIFPLKKCFGYRTYPWQIEIEMERLFIEAAIRQNGYSSKRLFIKAAIHQIGYSSKRLFTDATQKCTIHQISQYAGSGNCQWLFTFWHFH
jgi:hypothetical protein